MMLALSSLLRPSGLMAALLCGAALCTGCGGGHGDDAAGTVAAAPADPVATAQAVTAQPVVVRARADLAGGVGARMRVRVNGQEIGNVIVGSSLYANYTFSSTAVKPGALIDVVFDNDGGVSVGGVVQDRNLYVDSVTVLGRTYSAGSPGVTLDRGLGPAAFDGYDTLPGQPEFYWDGALRFIIPASEPTWTTVAAANAALGHGVNLGGLFESAKWPGKWSGLSTDEVARIYPGVIDELARQGYRNIRMPVRWTLHASSGAAATLDPKLFQLLDPLVDRAIARGLYVILDAHNYWQLDGDTETAMADEDPLVDPAVVQTRLISIWRQIAQHYAGRSKYLMFELYNEPSLHTDAQGRVTGGLSAGAWNAFYPKLLAEVRRWHPTRPVIIDSAQWASADALWDLQWPAGDAWLIASAHAYAPADFAVQGFGGVPAYSTVYTPAMMAATQSYFDAVGLYARTRKRPVYIGEYGGTNQVPTALDRTRHLQLSEQSATRNGLSMSAFDIGTMPVDGSVDFSFGQVVPGAGKAHLTWPVADWRIATLGQAGLPALPAVATNLAPVTTAFTGMYGTVGSWDGTAVNWPGGGSGAHSAQYVVVRPTVPLRPDTAYRILGRFTEHAHVLVAIVDGQQQSAMWGSPGTIWIDVVGTPDYAYRTPAKLPANASWLFIFRSGRTLSSQCIDRPCGLIPVRPGLTYTARTVASWLAGTMRLSGRAASGASIDLSVGPTGQVSFTVPAGMTELKIGGSGQYEFDLYSSGDAPAVSAAVQVVGG